MGWNIDEEYDRFLQEEREEEEYLLIENIMDFIEERSAEDEPPDNDTIEEALGLSGDYCWDDVIEEAYRQHYKRRKK